MATDPIRPEDVPQDICDLAAASRFAEGERAVPHDVYQRRMLAAVLTEVREQMARKLAGFALAANWDNNAVILCRSCDQDRESFDVAEAVGWALGHQCGEEDDDD